MIDLRVKRKTLYSIVIVILAILLLFTAIKPTIAYADEPISLEKTNVLDDLKSSTVNGKAFDLKDYPLDEKGNVQIISFIEYCYSHKSSQRGNYGLFVYVYNPRTISISKTSSQNKIQMAVTYDAAGNPFDYEKFGLEFCSKVEEGDYKNLFYKFKVVDHKSNGKYFHERVNSNERRYDVSGIELLTHGDMNATEYTVGGTYKFTGFAKGCGPDENSESTLNCKVEQLETVELSVGHTFYRSKTSPLGAGHQNQLDTVYFSVPKRLLDDYGKLQRIKAEWYEYKTKEILVTSNTDLYNRISPYIGVETGTKNSVGTIPYNSDMYYSLAINAGDAGGGLNAAKWGWNLGTGYLHNACEALYYMFLVDDISGYDPYADTTSNGGVKSNELYDYITRYNKTFKNGKLSVKDGKISADLFEKDIDDSRKMNNSSGKIQNGYSYYDFDADVDVQTLTSWTDSSPSFWDNWINFGLGSAFTGGPTEASRTAAPIQIIEQKDLSGTNEAIANNLMVNVNDVVSLKSTYNDAITVNGKNDEEKVLVLFRFATSDYYSEAVDIMELGKGFLGADKVTKGQAYIAQESVFLDFDIIQLTFNKEGVYTVIPVVSSPMDIVGGITPPVITTMELDMWQIILLILGLICLLIIISPLLPYVIKGVWWVICLPFKAIGILVKGAKKKKKGEDEK